MFGNFLLVLTSWFRTALNRLTRIELPTNTLYAFINSLSHCFPSSLGQNILCPLALLRFAFHAFMAKIYKVPFCFPQLENKKNTNCEYKMIRHLAGQTQKRNKNLTHIFHIYDHVLTLKRVHLTLLPLQPPIVFCLSMAIPGAQDTLPTIFGNSSGQHSAEKIWPKLDMSS